MDQAGVGTAEAAGVEVEGGEVRLEVNVQPLAPGSLGVSGCTPDQLGTNALVLMASASLRVKEERVVAAVPGNVHEAHEKAVGGSRGDPTEAVRPNLIPPSGSRVAAVGMHKVDHLVIGYRPPPGIGDFVGHGSSLAEGIVSETLDSL